MNNNTTFKQELLAHSISNNYIAALDEWELKNFKFIGEDPIRRTYYLRNKYNASLLILGTDYTKSFLNTTMVGTIDVESHPKISIAMIADLMNDLYGNASNDKITASIEHLIYSAKNF